MHWGEMKALKFRSGYFVCVCVGESYFGLFLLTLMLEHAVFLFIFYQPDSGLLND